jgi:hypothetical protein
MVYERQLTKPAVRAASTPQAPTIIIRETKRAYKKASFLQQHAQIFLRNFTHQT